MKKTMIAVAFAAFSLPASAARTVEGKIACQSEQWYNDFFEFAASGDNQSMIAYVKSQKCFPLKGGMTATVHSGPGLLGGHWEVTVKGVRLHVQLEGISLD